MITVTGIGRVTADLTPQTSPKGTEYLRFNLAVSKGFGENQKTVFLQCWLYGEKEVQRTTKAKVQKGSLLCFTGDLDIEEYKKKDGTPDKSMKVALYDWSYVPSSGKPKDDASVQPNLNTPAHENAFDGIESDDDLPL